MWGAALVLLAGLLQGTFAVPMKYAPKWKHEHIWFVFALSGLIIFPWLLAWTTVPSLGAVLSGSSSPSLAAVIGFGLCWGIGATLTGLGLKMLGIGLGFAIILGISASIGSLVPLLVLTPAKLFTQAGALYVAGTVVMLAGIGAVSSAGALREKAEKSAQVAPRASFLSGFLMCVAAGLLSSTLNFSFAFGSDVLRSARDAGADPVWAGNIVAALATTGGFVANAVYCGYLMTKHRTAAVMLAPGTASHWLGGFIMGGFWFGGLAIYGVGLSKLGTFGTVAGWPVLMGTVIISSNAAGFVTGEWKNAGRDAKMRLAAGSVVILAALAVLAMAQRG